MAEVRLKASICLVNDVPRSSRLLDVLDVERRFGGGIDAVAQEFRAGVDDRQDIVEVVRHSSRQPANRFHLLGLDEAGPQPVSGP